MMQDTSRQEMLNYIQATSKSSWGKVEKLLEKETEFIEKGNKYGVKFTKRQFDLAVDPIIKAEHTRSRILELTRTASMSVREISERLELATKEVLQHITVLRFRNLIVTDSVDKQEPKYRGLPEE